MKRTLVFTRRNVREILRDPLSLVFCFGLPVLMELLMTFINKSIPPEANMTVFQIAKLAPGIITFSFSFITLFTGLLIAGDRTSTFLERLYTSPMRSWEFLCGYVLSLIPVALIQAIVCCLVWIIFGLKITGGILLMLLLAIPVCLVFVGLGVIVGTLFSDKQVGGFSSILITVISLSCGVWMDLESIGGIMLRVSSALPFYHVKRILYAASSGNYTGFGVSCAVCAGYLVVFFIIAVLLFRRRMKK